MDANYALGEQWQLAVAASWAEHLYDNNPDPSLGDIDRNDIDTAPNLQANTRLRWHASEKWLAELEWHDLGDYYLDPQNLHKYSGHSLLNLCQARPGLAWQQDIWRLAERMTNLADRDYAERADFAFVNYSYFVGQGRGLYLNAAYSW